MQQNQNLTICYYSHNITQTTNPNPNPNRKAQNYTSIHSDPIVATTAVGYAEGLAWTQASPPSPSSSL